MLDRVAMTIPVDVTNTISDTAREAIYGLTKRSCPVNLLTGAALSLGTEGLLMPAGATDLPMA